VPSPTSSPNVSRKKVAHETCPASVDRCLRPRVCRKPCARRCRSEQGAAHRVTGHRNARSASVQRRPFGQRDHGDRRRPLRIRLPRVAGKAEPGGRHGAPEITDRGKTWTIRLKPGIHFIDDPAFRGKPREVTADDYVYSLKRWLNPNLRRGGDPIVTDLLIGAREVVDAARKGGADFDYNRPIAGLKALDRYTVQLKLKEPNYPNIEQFLTTCAVAREVVDAAGGDIRARPVGTGAYRLREWKRGSRVVLDANPGYRTVRYPDSSDPALAPMIKEMRGKTLPQVGVIEINVIEEDVTRLLEFDRGKLDVVVLRGEIAARMLSGGKLKPEYAARGIVRQVAPEPYLFSIYVNVADPVIGGMTNEKIALRRAIALGFDVDNLIKVLYAGQALPANQLVPPGVTGHDPEFAPRPAHDPKAANALLDRLGYAQRDADGYRRAPNGTPLTMTLSLRTGAISREIQTQWKKDMDAIGLRMDYRLTPFQDLIKDLEGGKFQLYFGGYGGIPSGYAELMQLYGKEPPSVNASRFASADYDRAMEEYLAQRPRCRTIATARRCRSSRVRLYPSSRRSSGSRTTSCSPGFSAIARRSSNVLEIHRHRSRTPAPRRR
jgi:ABC-type transport system substrate-binding protein